MKQLFLITEVTTKLSKKGEEYQEINARDTSGNQIFIYSWSFLMNLGETQLPAVYEIDVDDKTNWPKTNNMPEKKDDVGMSIFFPAAKVDGKSAWAEFKAAIALIKNERLNTVVSLYASSLAKKAMSPLTADSCFSRQIGLLEATTSLLRSVTPFLGRGYNDDVLLAGAALYYAGAMTTISDTYSHNIEAPLLGTGFAGVEALMNYFYLAEDDKKPTKDELMVLKHILISRSTGIMPTTPEALILRKLDDLVCALDGMNEVLSGMKEYEVSAGHFKHFRKVVKI